MLRGSSPSLPPALQDVPVTEVRAAVIDLETTGLHPARGDEVIELAAVRVDGLRVRPDPCFSQLVNPGRPVSRDAFAVHGIPDDALAAMPSIEEVIDPFVAFLEDRIVVGHNVAFDLGFLERALERTGRPALHLPVLDTLCLSRLMFPSERYHSLDAVSRRLGAAPSDRHRALGDAMLTARVFVSILRLYHEKHPPARLQDLFDACARVEARRLGAPEVLQELERGARERRVVEMAYIRPSRPSGTGGSAPAPRHVHIYHLSPPYMIAYCQRGRRVLTFRTDRVTSARCLDARFEVPPGFDPRDHVRRGS